MQKTGKIFLVLLTAVLLLWGRGAEAAVSDRPEEAKNPVRAQKAQWTIMIYLCGSDLESANSLASYNLKEIASTCLPDELVGNNRVNVLIETGGSKAWHAKEGLGLDIAVNRLQRYSYDPEWHFSDDPNPDIFTLQDETELASMGAAQTLSDFIRWSAESYPAEKYGLILWDHGGGSKTGLFVDELFDQDILYLYELEEALNQADIWMELVAIDACLMGSLETAMVLKGHASYMAASEELAFGYGSAFEYWLNELYSDQDCSGEQLGRVFCNMTEKKYSEMGDLQANAFLTYSVIDLSKIDRVAECFDELFRRFADAYEKDPVLLAKMCSMLQNTDQFGGRRSEMLDLGSIFYNNQLSSALDLDFRGRMLDALSDAVVYMVRGSGRTGANGLSFHYGGTSTSAELDSYMKNCKSAPYLAYLDAITLWDAPEWVYDTEKKLTEIDLDSAYNPHFFPETEDNGLPVIKVSEEDMDMLGMPPYYELYQLDEASGLYRKLGKDICVREFISSEEGNEYYFLTDEISVWPSIEGQLIDIEAYDRTRSVMINYEIPVQMDSSPFYLRMTEFCEEEMMEMYDNTFIIKEGGALKTPSHGDTYMIHGLWTGYDEETGMPGRDSRLLIQAAGQEYQLRYPVYSEKPGRTEYLYGDTLTMTRNLDVKEMALPAGRYLIRFILTDIFGREFALPAARFTWDGSRAVLDEGTIFNLDF